MTVTLGTPTAPTHAPSHRSHTARHAGVRPWVLGRPAPARPVTCRWCASFGADEIEFGWYSAVLPRALADLDPRVVSGPGVDDVTTDDLAYAATCRGTGDRPVLDLVARATAQAPGHAATLPLVDIGAGTGGPAAWLHSRTGRPVVAVDPSPESLRAARALFGGRAGLGIVRGDAYAVPLPDGTAGAVTMLGLLSLVPDTRAALAEARRIVVAGATLVVTDYTAPDERAVGATPLPEGTTPDIDVRLVHALAASGWDVEHVVTGATLPDRAWRACRDAVDSTIARHVSLTDHGTADACPRAHEAEQRARDVFAAAIDGGRLRRTTVVARAR